MDEEFIIQNKEKINNYYSNKKIKEKIEIGKKALENFLRKYDFRTDPTRIDGLTAEDIWYKGSKESFFYYIEYGTQNLGKIFNYGGITYVNAQNNLELFKSLLKEIVNDDKSLAEKIDNINWDRIKGFGGDRLIIKKIISCYYYDEILPIFKTDHLKSFCSALNLDFKTKAQVEYKKSYEELTVGQKFELLNKLLFKYKNSTLFKSWDNAHFIYLLYKIIKTEKDHPQNKVIISEPKKLKGLLYTPSSEQEVVYLFSNIHKELGFPYIITFQTQFPDVKVLDTEGNNINIEIEYLASNFKSHHHDKSKCNYIVCWENDLNEIDDDFPSIIELKSYFGE